MKSLFVLLLALSSMHIFAQNASSENKCNNNSSQSIAIPDDNSEFEVYDDVFLFKNSSYYAAIKCHPKDKSSKENNCNLTLNQQSKRNQQSNVQCSINKTALKLEQKHLYAVIK